MNVLKTSVFEVDVRLDAMDLATIHFGLRCIMDKTLVEAPLGVAARRAELVKKFRELTDISTSANAGHSEVADRVSEEESHVR